MRVGMCREVYTKKNLFVKPPLPLALGQGPPPSPPGKNPSALVRASNKPCWHCWQCQQHRGASCHHVGIVGYCFLIANNANIYARVFLRGSYCIHFLLCWLCWLCQRGGLRLYNIYLYIYTVYYVFSINYLINDNLANNYIPSNENPPRQHCQHHCQHKCQHCQQKQP
jgi:hypothetical protein